MPRKRIAPRFFIFLSVLVLVLITAIFFLTRKTIREDVIFMSDTAYEQMLDAVIIRDETAVSSSTTVRAEYLVAEDTLVTAGTEIAYLYANGYTENLLTRLETTRKNIQEYHKQLLGNIVDTNLDRLDEIVTMTAKEFCALAVNKTRGSLRFSVDQLKQAMSNRQEYLRQNKRDDTKLSKLYDEENTRQTSIQSWRTVSTAENEGVVSYYLDGYEQDVNASLLEHLTPADIQTVLNHGMLAATNDLRNDGIYRIVNQDTWYVAVLAYDDTWNPVVGQQYYLKLSGYDDLSFSAEVTNAQKASNTMLAVFRIDAPIGPLIYERQTKATLSITLSSLAVHTEALANVGGETGVWLYDTPGGTFVQVEVLSEKDGIALIAPMVEGTITDGQKILIK